MLSVPGILFADNPVHLTHTAFIDEENGGEKDLSPIGKQPYRFLAFNLGSSGVTVGILANIYTRVDLVYKSLVGANIPKALFLTDSNPRASVVEI